MNCGYCEKFCTSKFRINPDSEEGKKKSGKQSRHCKTINKYIPRDNDICDGFTPYHLFWCNRNKYQQHVDACISRAAKGMCEECFGCSQHKTIVDVAKARHFLKRRIAKELEEASKPKLVRRIL